MDSQQEYVLRTIEEREIRFVRLWFTDILGSLKSVAVAPAELESAFKRALVLMVLPLKGSPEYLNPIPLRCRTLLLSSCCLAMVMLPRCSQRGCFVTS